MMKKIINKFKALKLWQKILLILVVMYLINHYVIERFEAEILPEVQEEKKVEPGMFAEWSFIQRIIEWFQSLFKWESKEDSEE